MIKNSIFYNVLFNFSTDGNRGLKHWLIRRGTRHNWSLMLLPTSIVPSSSSTWTLAMVSWCNNLSGNHASKYPWVRLQFSSFLSCIFGLDNIIYYLCLYNVLQSMGKWPISSLKYFIVSISSRHNFFGQIDLYTNLAVPIEECRGGATI